jgi:hypothetical protein
MLSNDELVNGTPFTLKLWDAVGAPTEWSETLSGDLARRWYDIYRRSDWEALRREGPAVFHHRVDGTVAGHARPYGERRVLINTRALNAAEMGAAVGGLAGFGREAKRSEKARDS